MNNEISTLKAELTLIKRQFSERVNSLEAKLIHLEHQDQLLSSVNGTPVIQEDIAEPIGRSNQEINNKATVSAEHSEASLERPKQKNLRSNAFVGPIKPSFLILFFHTLLSSFFDFFSPIQAIYQSYKDRGMIGIFILTIAGVGLTLSGFGYLMQLLIDQLGGGQKSLLMLFAAVAVIGFGLVLKIKTKFGEFSTAIVTLGVLLTYSTVYFAGSVYQIIPPLLVVALYLVIAFGCHAMSLWLDTKVMAALGIIGITTMPILSNSVQLEPLYYLFSLIFVLSSSLMLAQKHLGQWLANLSLAFTFLALEWLINIEGIALSAWLVNVFYYLFFTYVVVELYKQNQQGEAPETKQLSYLAAMVGATVLLFFQAEQLFSSQMSWCFGVNAIIAAVVAVLFYKIKHPTTGLMVLLASVWAVLAIVSAVGNAYWGVAWAIEGLLLLYMAKRFAIASVVHQAQSLMAIALLYSFGGLAPYFPLPALQTLDGALLSGVIVFVIATWQRMISHDDTFDVLTQQKIKPLLQLFEAIWLSLLALSISYIYLGDLTGVLAISLQIALLCRAKQCKHFAIEVFAALLIIIPLLYLYQGGIESSSFRFTYLPLYAQLSLISAFAQLWLWSAFYRKYQPNSQLIKLAEATRILFYLLIPICWIGSAMRRFEENSLLILWLSPLVSLFFARKTLHQLIQKECKTLTVLASLIFILAISQLQLVAGLVACLGFGLFYLAAYLSNKKSTSDIYQFICSWGLISFGFAPAVFIGEQSNSLFLGVCLVAIYWGSAFNLLSQSVHLKRNERLITLINLLIVLFAWVFTQSDPLFALIPISFLLASLYQKQVRYHQSWLAQYFTLNSDLLLHGVGAITYILAALSLSDYRADLLIAPLLAVHGAMILFIKDRRLTTVKFSFVLILLGISKLALIDAAHALLWQKVILFMGIGLFILAATFWYQKLVGISKRQ